VEENTSSLVMGIGPDASSPSSAVAAATSSSTAFFSLLFCLLIVIVCCLLLYGEKKDNKQNFRQAKSLQEKFHSNSFFGSCFRQSQEVPQIGNKAPFLLCLVSVAIALVRPGTIVGFVG